MDLKNNFPLPLLLRGLGVASGVLYWAALADQSAVAPNLFRAIAIAQIVSSVIPFGSFNQLSNMPENEGALLERWCLLVIAVSIPGAFVFGVFGALPLLTGLIYYERLAFARSLRSLRTEPYFAKLLIGRLASLLLIWNLAPDPNFAVQYFVAAEVLARLPLANLSVFMSMDDEATKCKVFAVNTLTSALGAAAPLLPIVFSGSDSEGASLFYARTILMLFGFSSVFYLSNEVLKHCGSGKVRFGFVRDRQQIAVIGVCATVLSGLFVANRLFDIFWFSDTLGSISYSQFFALLSVILLWLFSWNGAIVISRHTISSELKLSLFCFACGLVFLFAPVAVYWQVLLVAAAWHLFVVLFYK